MAKVIIMVAKEQVLVEGYVMIPICIIFVVLKKKKKQPAYGTCTVCVAR